MNSVLYHLEVTGPAPSAVLFTHNLPSSLTCAKLYCDVKVNETHTGYEKPIRSVRQYVPFKRENNLIDGSTKEAVSKSSGWIPTSLL
jgi:hypothetical protein